MAGKSINKKLSEYNSIIKENEEIYHKIARKFGLSDCAFWILYTMCEEEGTLTQSSICDALYQPKQTVNSALMKKMSPSSYRKEMQKGETRKNKEYLKQIEDFINQVNRLNS